ncbi:MAG: IS3 family transposase [Roseburia sp.]|nr:IS3 family transposase [Roseburia sp.]MCM1278322.1 IS3 family transposase [Robinsoniella sp.]
MTLRRTRHLDSYTAIKELSEEHDDYPVSEMCRILEINRAAYYKWKNHENSQNDTLNELIAGKVEKIHAEHPDMGYRRIRDTLEHDHDINVNDKRILRICRKKKIQSYVKHRYNCCTKPASDPAYVAENILNREFKSDRPNEKWLTDVSEFKYGIGEDEKKGKIYLSVILDLCGNRPIAIEHSDHNDNPLVFNTFDKALSANPGAKPIFHSDRGYQYTSKIFRQKIVDAGMIQSMSRVGRCIDNGPMEGFWGTMKREMYYGRKYKTKEALIKAIEDYIDYYTNKRVQRNLGIVTPMEFYKKKLQEAA